MHLRIGALRRHVFLPPYFFPSVSSLPSKMSSCHTFHCYCQYTHDMCDDLEPAFDADSFNPHDESSDPEYDISELRYEIDVEKFNLSRNQRMLKAAQEELASSQSANTFLKSRIRDLTDRCKQSEERLAMLNSKLTIFLSNYPEFA